MSQHSAAEQGAAARPELRNAFDVFTGIATGIVLLDAAGAVLSVNPVAAQRLSRPATEALGLDLFREVLPELEESGLGARYREGMEESGSVTLEWEGSPGQGATPARVWLGIRSVRFNGSDWGIVVVEDRSALVEEEERRRRAERLAAVGELAAGVAHEVNNPLASIKSFAQLLAREASGSEQQRALEIIVEESARIARVVDNLISFARQQGVSGREPVNLSDLAGQVLEMQKYALDTAGIEVRLDLDRNLSPVMGEAGALHQVVLNLVTNAGEALASKPGPRLLIVRTRESSEGVLLSVVDNGPGIPRAVLPHIFDGVADVSGSGLGLGISATIVRDHGGQIMAESEEGRGAAFFVRLPRSGVAAAPEAARAAGGGAPAAVLPR
ncbi:MAG TPA: ATP-binding protein, partial [Longimicrobiaceae bacterium]|nr:ATP-binding protein [Longimicrobiaceae bacterium]